MTSLELRLGSGGDYASLADARTKATTTPAALQTLSIHVADDAVYDPLDLAAFTSSLAPSATVEVHTSASSSSLEAVHTSFLLAGLVGASERRLADGTRVVTAQRGGNRASVPARTIAQPVRLDAASSNSSNWIDEDDLLAEAGNILAPPPDMTKATATDDCAGREPCADCTCGRADQSPTTTAATVVPSTSACGKCGLGDAFRCASCPYLGKPAFKAGEEHLVLDLQDDL